MEVIILSNEKIVEQLLQLTEKVEKLEKIIIDMGYDSQDGEFSGIVYDQSTEEVVNYLDSQKKMKEGK
jgi:hypothetical protein